MLNKKEYIMLELVKMAGHMNMIDQKCIEGITEWILQSGEEYQLELEDAERIIDDEAETLELDNGEL